MKTTNVIETHVWESPFGELLLGSIRGRLCMCDWLHAQHRRTIDNRLQRQLGAIYQQSMPPVIIDAIRQLEQYFAGIRREFSLPLQYVGTKFQCNVWSYLSLIPYGTTVSYGELAELVASGKDIRAVSGAVGSNALSIIVPCHRVVGVRGRLTGYAGGLDAKKGLLDLEAKFR